MQNALISEGERKSSVKVHFCHLLLCSSNLGIERIMGGVRGYLRLFVTPLLTLVCIESLTVR